MSDTVRRFLRAFHGSDRRFNAFDQAQIGSRGVGRQVPAHGHHFADDPLSAYTYGEINAQPVVFDEYLANQRRLHPIHAPPMIEKLLTHGNRYDPVTAAQEVVRERMGQTFNFEFATMPRALRRQYERLVEVGENLEAGVRRDPVGVYDTRIHTPPSRIIDFDAPLDVADPRLRRRLQSLVPVEDGDIGSDVYHRLRMHISGGQLGPTLQRDANLLTPEEVTSGVLNDAGVFGARYRDPTARAGLGGTNHVIFDDEPLEIRNRIEPRAEGGVVEEAEVQHMAGGGVVGGYAEGGEVRVTAGLGHRPSFDARSLDREDDDVARIEAAAARGAGVANPPGTLDRPGDDYPQNHNLRRQGERARDWRGEAPMDGLKFLASMIIPETGGEVVTNAGLGAALRFRNPAALGLGALAALAGSHEPAEGALWGTQGFRHAFHIADQPGKYRGPHRPPPHAGNLPPDDPLAHFSIEDSWRNTGWYADPRDGKLRTEIPDRWRPNFDAYMANRMEQLEEAGLPHTTMPLASIYGDADFRRAYPSLSNLTMRVTDLPASPGEIAGGLEGTRYLRPITRQGLPQIGGIIDQAKPNHGEGLFWRYQPDQYGGTEGTRSALMREIQRAIDEREGFAAAAGNPVAAQHRALFSPEQRAASFPGRDSLPRFLPWETRTYLPIGTEYLDRKPPDPFAPFGNPIRPEPFDPTDDGLAEGGMVGSGSLPGAAAPGQLGAPGLPGVNPVAGLPGAPGLAGVGGLGELAAAGPVLPPDMAGMIQATVMREVAGLR